MDIATLVAASDKFDPEWLAGVGEFLTGIAVFVFGYAGLRQYQEGHRLDAARMLLKMEKEFRCIADTCSSFEIGKTYAQTVKPLVEKLNCGVEQTELTPDEVALMQKMDRALRFFYVCTILHRELHVDEGTIGRAYYYWLSVLIKPERKDLHDYIRKYYWRLADWLAENVDTLKKYQVHGSSIGR